MVLIRRLFRFRDLAAVVTWAVISGITLSIVHGATGVFEGAVWPTAAWQLVYLAAMLVAGANGTLPGEPLTRWAALGLQLIAALALGLMLPLEFLQIYTIIWIAVAASVLPLRICVGFLVSVIAMWYAIGEWVWEDDNALFQTLLFGTFHYFAMISSVQARRAERAREEAQSLNQELVATQHLLAEASRQSERTRIARDLHDLLGHHLTALTINLQVASRLSDGEAREKIDQSHALARLLLSDVREAVTTIRKESALDFGEALRLLIDNIPRLNIELDIGDDLRIDDVNVAESLLRCVQEAITNTLRHSRATRSWIRVWRQDGRVHLHIRDNGSVDAPLRWGNGLSGMRERVERLRGDFSVERVRRAVEISIQVPAAGAT